MVNATVMNLRPGNLFKDFNVQTKTEAPDEYNRSKPVYREERWTLRGCLASAKSEDRERWQQLQHPITHTIVQAGRPLAKAEDRLIVGERLFIIHAVDDCGGLGITTIYYAEERDDLL